ncbi:SCO5918 family protein [Kitasatospora sp. NPDC057223]|uniref:SCO5918 family protein n=1 Tax=Kitasatospora sp. NPDC057223 TaxID=3346055 RepID=UPI003636BC5C
MRSTIAGRSFYLEANEVEKAMAGIKPEPALAEAVRIGRRWYPVKQVGAIITRQDRRDFSAAEVYRAMERLGFTCRTAPPVAETPEPVETVEPTDPTSF